MLSFFLWSVYFISSGAIFKPGDKQAATAFRYQNSLYNSIETNPFSLASYIDHIDVADSFTLASQSKWFDHRSVTVEKQW